MVMVLWDTDVRGDRVFALGSVKDGGDNCRYRLILALGQQSSMVN